MAFQLSPQVTTLAIRGGPDISQEAPLTLVGPGAVSGNPTLFLAANPSQAIPLAFAALPGSSGNTSLYISAIATSDPTASGWQAYTTLAIPATSGVFHSGSFPLFLEVNPTGTLTNTASLATSGVANVVTTNATFFVSGGTASAAGNVNQNISLFVGRDFGDDSSVNIPLFMKEDFNTSNNTTLYINNRMGSGHLPLALTCTDISSDNIPLFITPPSSGQITLYTRGYLE
jgi:hypothetical protein|tara:strand:- start:1364 stop:2053 length:690 start_codon:yes stop_codon:yes gene_type:complete